MWKVLALRTIALLEPHNKLLNIGSKNKYCLKLQQLSPSTANAFLTHKWSQNLEIISSLTFGLRIIPPRNGVFSLGFSWNLNYLLAGKWDAFCARFWRKNWDITLKVGGEHENTHGTKSATICIWLHIWTPWIFLDNILFGEIQSPPQGVFFFFFLSAKPWLCPSLGQQLLQAELEVTLVFHPCRLSQPHITHRSKPSLLPWHLVQEAKGTLDPASRQNPEYSSFTRPAVGISQLGERGSGTTPGKKPHRAKNTPQSKKKKAQKKK